jgi:hypothetical protein
VTAVSATPTPSAAATAVRRRAAIELGVLQGLYVLFVVPWFLLSVAGAMAAGSSGDLLAVLLVYAWFGYPLVALATTIAAWVLFGTGHPVAARWVNRTPLAWVVVGGAFLTWILIAA